MQHLPERKTLLVTLSCGCEATLRKNIQDGLDLVEFKRNPSCPSHKADPALPQPVVGFGPLWSWDANRSDRRELPAVKVALFEPEHVYKLLEGYVFINDPGRGHPALGQVAKIRWAEVAAHH